MKNHPANAAFITFAGLPFSFLQVKLCDCSCDRKIFKRLAFDIGRLCFQSGTMITKYCVVYIYIYIYKAKKLLENDHKINCNVLASIA